MLVEVGVVGDAVTVEVGGGEGWLPQDAMKRNVPNIRIGMTRRVGCVGVIHEKKDWYLRLSSLGLLENVLFTKFSPSRMPFVLPIETSWGVGKGQVCPGIISKLLPFQVLCLRGPGKPTSRRSNKALQFILKG